MKNPKKAIIIALALVSAVALTVGSLAFFTDRIDASVTAKAGTLKLAMSEIETSKTANLKPGDGITVEFTLSNDGNKSADVQETLVLRSSQAFSADAEFDLYKAEDVTIGTNGYATVTPGAQPLQTRSVSDDNTRITYAVEEFILNGTGIGAETEPEAVGTAKASSYVLVFNPKTGNSFRGVSLSLDYIAQAKQHRNTSQDTWTELKNETVNFTGYDMNLVPDVPDTP